MAPPHGLSSPNAGPSRRPSRRLSDAERTGLPGDRVIKRGDAAFPRARPGGLTLASTTGPNPYEFHSDESLPHNPDDEHSSRQFNIDLAALRLEGSVEATHIELSRRAAIDDSAYAALVYKHLVATSPPNSPTTPPKAQLSPRTKAFQESLMVRDFKGVMELDGLLHDQLKDL